MKIDGLKWIWGTLGPFVVAWSLTVWALIAKALDALPFFGKVDVNSAIVYSMPVVGACWLILALTARRYAQKHQLKSVRHRIIYSQEKMDGPGNWMLTGGILCIFLLIPFLVETLMILRMNNPGQMSIWDRDNGESLSTIYQVPINPFNFMRFRWDIYSGITAIPCYQPVFYLLLYLSGGAATISAFVRIFSFPLVGTKRNNASHAG